MAEHTIFQSHTVEAFARATRRRMALLLPDNYQYGAMTEQLALYRRLWEQLQLGMPDLPPFDEATAPDEG